MRNALIFAFPSVYEGFGLPVIDAQARGVPVACSAVAAVPEVAGDGALYFDPHSIPEMAGALRRCFDEPALRRDLIERGYENVRRFSWERAAEQTLGVYRDALGRS
jgi:glycosyltransferase involved in cell wall biosynthesis